MTTRDELVMALAVRYALGSRADRGRMLDEFAALTGHHRKHAMRLLRMAEIFVAVLGASTLTYAESTWTQTLPDWIGAHVRMFRYFGATPRLLVPDNLKGAIHKASFYDPEMNRSYGAMAAHCRVSSLPARPRRPRDKAAVEAGVPSPSRFRVCRFVDLRGHMTLRRPSKSVPPRYRPNGSKLRTFVMTG